MFTWPISFKENILNMKTGIFNSLFTPHMHVMKKVSLEEMFGTWF